MANTPQDSPQSQLQPITAIKRPRSRKAPAIKTAVILQRAQGKPISHIAKDLGMTHNTARAIIQESDIDRQMEAGKTLCVGLVPKSIDAIEKTLDKGDGYLGIKLLTGLGILGTEQKAKNMSVAPNLHLQIMNLVGKPAGDKAIDIIPDTQVVDNKDVG